MTEALAWAAAVLAVILVVLIGSIIVRRFIGDRRRARDRRLRPTIEAAIVDFLVGDGAEAPELPTSRAGQDVVRTVAIEALAELRGAERDRLVELLERSGAVAEIAGGLQSQRWRVRRDAAEALGYIASPAAADSLLAAVDDPHPDTRISCAAALAELPDPALAPPILAVAGELAADRPGPVAAILITLGRRHPAALDVPLAPEAPLEVRRLAAAVAGEFRLAEHADRLREALASDDDELVARGARGLGLIGEVAALDELLALIEERDRSSFVRLAATNALGAIGNPRAAPALARELEADSWLLQERAAAALKLLGEAGEGVLRAALSSPVETAREHARVALES